MNTRKKTVHTMESLMQWTEEYGECIEWTKYYQNGVPYVCQDGQLMAVRKLILLLQGHDVPKGAFVGTTCGNPKCVNPKHIIARSISDHAKLMAKNVDHNCLLRKNKLWEASKAKRVLTENQVINVMMDERPTREIAEEYGVSKSLVCRIKRGQSNAYAIAKNNPFFGLMRA